MVNPSPRVPFAAVTAMAISLVSGATCWAQTAPARFAPTTIPAAVTTAAPTFTPDAHEVYLSAGNGFYSVIVQATRRGGQWSKLRVAPFSGQWRDLEPAMAPDGSFLVFASNRPATAGQPALDRSSGGKLLVGQGGNLWMVVRQRAGKRRWSEPLRLPDIINSNTAVFSPSVVADGSLYFMRSTGASGTFQLYRSQRKAGVYQTPELLPFNDGIHGSFDPAVDPGERFAVFSSGRPPATGTDLFITYRRQGQWTAPQDISQVIGVPAIEARLGPDGHTLYYTTSQVAQPQYPAPGAYFESLAWNNGLGHIWSVDLAKLGLLGLVPR